MKNIKFCPEYLNYLSCYILNVIIPEQAIKNFIKAAEV